MAIDTSRRQVGVRELRQNLSVYLKEVRKGETLEVTEHGQPVAVLAPLPPKSTYERLVAEGRILPATGRWEDRPAPHPAPHGWDSLKILDEIREDKI